MLLKFWLEGILIGVLASAPLGPIGILVIQRTLNHGRTTGFYSGLGAALSDLVYAAFAGFGMALIVGIIKQHEVWVKLAGAIILVLLGIFIFFSHPERQAVKKLNQRINPFKHIAGTFAIGISNPHIMLFHVAMFSGFGIVFSHKNLDEVFFVLLGVTMGCLLWWFSLSWLIDLFRARFSVKILLWFNRIAGVAIIVFVIIYMLKSLV
ncbi:LysE family transporter [Maribellus sp. YY47]|uniref:LysE family translocator n=1 Tax=Maribellus sp. YY47 TaxID=2929486 RepID=UPI002000F172|nr:LysE family transporter [Maribellus sp. YY47]MCK3685284.1 LysE family transporter [Maribellus sp. YY47]